MIEFTIEREVFLKGIQKTLGIVERKVTMPILGNILIAAAGEGVRIMATDREISLEIGYRASVIKEGRITLPARKVYEAVRELAGETLHLVEGIGSTAILTSNKAVCKLRGLPADDFPSAANPEEYDFFKMKAVLLREMLGKVCFAVATDEERNNLRGVFLEKEIDCRDLSVAVKTLIRMVATDGHRLALVQTDMAAQEDQNGEEFSIPDKGVIIPRKGVQEIRKILEGEEEDVSIGIRKGACVVKNEKDSCLSVLLIDGEFPDYRRVIPEQGDDDVVIKIAKAALLHALRRMGVIEPGRV